MKHKGTMCQIFYVLFLTGVINSFNYDLFLPLAVPAQPVKVLLLAEDIFE